MLRDDLFGINRGPVSRLIRDKISSAIANSGTDVTVSGNPISVSNAKAKPASACTVAFSPVQDLNGYSNPWPGGGWKEQV